MCSYILQPETAAQATHARAAIQSGGQTQTQVSSKYLIHILRTQKEKEKIWKQLKSCSKEKQISVDLIIGNVWKLEILNVPYFLNVTILVLLKQLIVTKSTIYMIEQITYANS